MLYPQVSYLRAFAPHTGGYFIMLRLSAFVALFLLALPVAAQTGADPVVAIVNGADIRLSEVKDARLRLPSRFQSMPLEAVFGLLVNSLVDSKLVSTEARKADLQKDEEVKRQMARIEDQVLERVYMARYIEKRITGSDVRKRYDRLVRDSSGAEEIRARHILLENEADARQVIGLLNDGGDFAELAKQRSQGPSAASGGDLGYFTAAQMVPAFSEAAFALKKGQITEAPVKTRFGWHVIRLDDRRMTKPPSFKDSENDIRMALSSDIANGYLQELRGKADVKRYNLDGSEMKDGK